MSNNKVNFYYDPQRQGYDTTLWKTLSGVPAISGTDLRFNAASAINYADIFKGKIGFNLTVPVGPAGGQARRFGFAQLNLGAYLGFRVDGAVFQVETIDGSGNTETSNITWDAAWTGVPVLFEIDWSGFSATFYINGVKKVFLNGVSVPKNPLSVYISNGAADNLDLTYLEVKDVQGYV